MVDVRVLLGGTPPESLPPWPILNLRRLRVRFDPFPQISMLASGSAFGFLFCFFARASPATLKFGGRGEDGRLKLSIG